MMNFCPYLGELTLEVVNMKVTRLIAVSSLCLSALAMAQQSINWNNSPDNWQNSASNWENSSENWNNSPQNWNNSPQNFNGTNGVFDSQGRRIGYEVQAASGVTNVYSNDGNRIGYVPSQRQ